MACEKAGGHLLIIEDEQENNFIKKILDNNAWLGLSDEQTEYIWRWVNNQHLVFSDWAKGQPDNYADKEHYAHYTLGADFYNWNDVANYNNYKFICEYDYEISEHEDLINYKAELIKNVDIITEELPQLKE